MAIGDGEFYEAVRAQIYRHFIGTGRAPSAADVAGALGRRAVEVERAFAALGEARAIALNPAGDGVRMAHPFSAVETPYRVEARGVSYHANCAWDALGIAAVLEADTAAAARCPDCGEAVDLSIKDGRVADSGAVIYFAVRPAHFWENIGFT
jgi:hypothetical protein